MLRFETLESRRLLAAYTVNHTPRIQLGNAPLQGFPGSETDQIEIMWQTKPADVEADDHFDVTIREITEPAARTLPQPTTIDTRTEGRVIHSVVATDLVYNSEYEYRVQHFRDDVFLDEYVSTFRTRLEPGDPTPFSFAQYGDSANARDIEGFELVHARLNEVNPAFSLLSGDNIYVVGSHQEADGRFDPSIAPEAAEYIASHVDYFSIGDHEMFSILGQPSRDSFSTPIPEVGITSSVAPPVGEFPEHNYSFDYGTAHFLSLDTNSFADPNRLSQQLEWAVADLNASDAQWKVVFAHHPTAGIAEGDDLHTPADDYYQQLVAALGPAGAGVDLFMVGNSHAYGWTYPLTGEADGLATFVSDEDREYEQGAGLVQVTAGVGGHSLRTGSVDQYPFVVAGFTSTTDPPSEFGFAHVEVTPDSLTVSYISATSGNVIDSFSIVAAEDNTGPTVIDIEYNAGIVNPPDLPTASQPTSWQQQRSQLRNILIRFDEPIQQIDVTDLELISLGVDIANGEATPLDLSDATLSTQENELLIELNGADYPDGALQLTVKSSVADVAGNPMATDYVFSATDENEFHILRGDWDGDGTVSIFDFATFAYWFGTIAPEYMDLNRDGGLGVFDFPAFTANFSERIAGFEAPQTKRDEIEFQSNIALPLAEQDPKQDDRLRARLFDWPEI